MSQVDQHLAGLPTTLNEQLLDRILRHKVMLQHYANGQVVKLNRLLRASAKDVRRQLVERLAAIEATGELDRGPETTRRLRQLMVALEDIIDGRYSKWAAMLEEELGDLGKAEGRFAAGAVQTTLPVHVEMTLPSPQLLAGIVTTQPFEGRIMRDWAATLAEGEKAAIAKALQEGMVLGETPRQLTQRVMGTGGAIASRKHHAEAIARTFVNHVSTHAHNMTYAANDKLIKGVQMVATLDSRTTPICRYQDGRVYPVDSGPRPPFHFNCRTAAVPVLKSFRELGVDLPEVAAGMRAAKGTIIGPVPEKLNYAKWFKRQGAAFQRDVLGARRYKLFKAGIDDIRRFATPDGHLFTLDELYRKFPEEARAAGLIDR